MLEHFLTLNTFHILLVFVRLGTVFMLLPGFSAIYVPVNVRLLLALVITLVVVSLVSPALPGLPDSAAGLIALVLGEAFIGVFMGLMAQVLMAALHLAGTSMGRDMGLMNAMAQDPVTEQQGAVIIGLLSNLAIVLMFVMDMHHLVIQAVVSTYSLFPAGAAPLASDHLAMYVGTLAQAFYIGLQLAAPFIVYALVMQVTLGVISRLSPQMNVFFIALPGQIMMGLVVFMIVLPSLMLWYLNFFEDGFTRFLP